MKSINTLLLLSLIGSMGMAAEPIQAPEDLSRATKNVLAGTVGKAESPVTGASQEVVGGDQAQDDNASDGEGRKSKKQKKKQVHVKPEYDYKREKIFNWILKTNDAIAKETNPQSSVRAVSFRGALAADSNSTKPIGATDIKVASSVAEKKYMQLTGTCTIPDDVMVMGTSKGVLSAYCNTSLGKYKLFGELIPNTQEYALLGKVGYVEDVYGKRFYPDQNNTYIMNMSKNSYNLATFINTYAINKTTKESIKSTAEVTKNTATQYMADLKASRTTQQTTMVANAGTAVATNTAKPVASDYVTLWGIQMTADMAEKWADFAFQDHPWSFMILGQTKISIDMKVDKGALK